MILRSAREQVDILREHLSESEPDPQFLLLHTESLLAFLNAYRVFSARASAPSLELDKVAQG